MITTYCTDNYYRYAELFLKSWKATNDNSEKICINTLNFNENQIKTLESIYENLIIVNEIMDFKEVYTKLDMTSEQFEKSRLGVREGFRDVGKNRSVITFFAVDKRVGSIANTVNKYKEEEDYFIQCDIDLLFRKPIEVLKMQYDAGLRFKLHREYECRKINIGFMFLKNNEKTVKLVNDWIDIVKSVPLNKRPTKNANKKLWGQYTFYKAYEMSDMKTFTITDSYFDNKYRDNSVVWSANRKLNKNKKIKDKKTRNKTNTYNFLKAEYENNICKGE